MKRQLHLGPGFTLPADEAVSQTFVVYGGKGTGKTNLGSVLAEELHAAGLRFCYLDPMGVAWGLRHGATRGETGLEVLILGGLHGDLPIEPTAGAVVADLVVDESVSVLIDVSRRASGVAWSKGEKIRFVRDYAVRLYERQVEKRRPLMQIFDEAARFAPQIARSTDPQVEQCLGAIETLCEEGRNLGVGVTFLTQRSARLNKSIAHVRPRLDATEGARAKERYRGSRPAGRPHPSRRKSQFRLPTAIARSARSTPFVSSGRAPSSKKRRSGVHWLRAPKPTCYRRGHEAPQTSPRHEPAGEVHRGRGDG
jgi:hypothetical protein